MGPEDGCVIVVMNGDRARCVCREDIEVLLEGVTDVLDAFGTVIDHADFCMG